MDGGGNRGEGDGWKGMDNEVEGEDLSKGEGKLGR